MCSCWCAIRITHHYFLLFIQCMILLTHLLLFHQYVNELLAGYSHSSYFGTARSYSKNNIQQRDNQSTGYNQPLPMSIISFISQSQNHLVRWLSSLLWRISESNRWPPACKAGALASWANPPFIIVNCQLNNCQLISGPAWTRTTDLYIISVAL